MILADKLRATLLRIAQKSLGSVLSERTIDGAILDVKRWFARRKNRGKADMAPAHHRLHFGCGWRHVPDWLNVDVRHSEHDVDLAGGRLPWRAGVFEAAVGQHVVEHLDLDSELLPLLHELRRVLQPGGELWLSCPDMEKVCRFYLDGRLDELLQDRRRRYPDFTLASVPLSHLVNDLFHARGQHRNLLDFTLLSWCLQEAGFVAVGRVDEAALLERFPAFPPRHDDMQSLYIVAHKPTTPEAAPH